MTRIVFIHGNGTEHWSFGWAPWLKGELENLGYETFFETMPDSIIARAQYWLPFLQDHVGVEENDIVVGWSSGAVAAMRYAETHRIKGSVLVSPCYTDLGDDMERQSGYYETPWNWRAIAENQQQIVVISGDVDPYIPQEEFKVIAKELGAEHIAMNGADHFNNQTTHPQVLDAVQQIERI